MKHFLLALTVGILAASSSPAFADAIPYQQTGTVAPTVATFASGNGINVYFYGSGANFTNTVAVKDLTSGYLSDAFFNNHSTAVGAEVTIGAAAGQIATGDQLVFLIYSPNGTFASNPTYSADGVNHAYVTTFSGGAANSVVIPAGLYVGLEDTTASNSDFNYHDDTFIFTGVAAPSIAATPEPSSLVLLGTGLLGIASLARRRFRNS